MSQTAEGPYLSYEEAAAYLGTTQRHLELLWARREITAVKIGRRVKFRYSDLDEYARRNIVQAVR